MWAASCEVVGVESIKTIWQNWHTLLWLEAQCVDAKALFNTLNISADGLC